MIIGMLRDKEIINILRGRLQKVDSMALDDINAQSQ